MRFLTIGTVLSATVSAIPIDHGHWQGSWPQQYAAKAAYFLYDDPSGSSIVSLQIGNNGQLSDPVMTSTNGFGAIGTNTTGFPNEADALMSQYVYLIHSRSKTSSRVMMSISQMKIIYSLTWN